MSDDADVSRETFCASPDMVDYDRRPGTIVMNEDAALARVARDLADALREFARERRPDQKLVVAELQTQLCATRRAELDSAAD